MFFYIYGLYNFSGNPTFSKRQSPKLQFWSRGSPASGHSANDARSEKEKLQKKNVEISSKLTCLTQTYKKKQVHLV